jgi:hypothetical protein
MSCTPPCAMLASGHLPDPKAGGRIAPSGGLTTTELEAIGHTMTRSHAAAWAIRGTYCCIHLWFGLTVSSSRIAMWAMHIACYCVDLQSDGTNQRVRHSRVHGEPPCLDRAHRHDKHKDLVEGAPLPSQTRVRSPLLMPRSSDGNFQSAAP